MAANGGTVPEANDRQAERLDRPSNDVQTYPAADPWTPIVLSFDGGGMRGFSSLIILQALMAKIALLEEHRGISNYHRRPCEYFDYIAGTSTGGLIAIMLGRLRTTAGEAMAGYKDFGKEVFGRRNLFRLTKYDQKKLKVAVKDFVIRHCSAHPMESDCDGECLLRQDDPEKVGQGNRCKTMVFAMREATREFKADDLYPFRSFDHPRRHNNPPSELEFFPGPASDSIKIYEAALATAAAPTFFDKAKIENTLYMDGGLGANNPSIHAYNEACQMHTDSPPEVALVVSIGTGKAKPLRRFGKGLFERPALLRYMRQVITESENSHIGMLTATRNGPPYYRFNVEDGLQHVKMDQCVIRHKRGHNVEYTTLNNIRDHTNRYCTTPEVAARLDSCAQTLVDYRSRRMAHDQPRWQRFTRRNRPAT